MTSRENFVGRENRKNRDEAKEILEQKEMVLDAKSQNKTQCIQ